MEKIGLPTSAESAPAQLVGDAVALLKTLMPSF